MEKKCLHCKSDIGDEFHYLFKCSHLTFFVVHVAILWINTIEQNIAFNAVDRLNPGQWQFSCHQIRGLFALMLYVPVNHFQPCRNGTISRLPRLKQY